MSMTTTFRADRGFTLVELLIAIVVFGTIMTGALSVLTSQTRAFRRGTDRMDVLQNLQFATDLVARDMRTLGANVPDEQPMLVYAGADVVAFSADYATNVANDPFAVYYDPDAPTGTVTAPTTGQASTIPGASFVFPAQNYVGNAGTNSPAEVIVFFFTVDSSTARTDDYALFRRVNNLPPELIARNLLRTSGVPFFQYFRVVDVPGQPTRVLLMGSTEIPVMHSAPVHQSPADTGVTGADAPIDLIRGVRLSFTATNGQTGTAERTRAITRLIRLPNAGMANREQCGAPPLLGTGLTATVVMVGGDPVVQLAWSQSTDEAGGEQDVVRYAIWRRLATEPDWGDPYLSIPAGEPTYVYDDAAIVSGQPYFYSLAAQDCTPSLSTLAIAGPVTAP